MSEKWDGETCNFLGKGKDDCNEINLMLGCHD